MTNAALEPCPFCGCIPEHDYTDHHGVQWWKCWDSDEAQCPIKGYRMPLAAWNQRPRKDVDVSVRKAAIEHAANVYSTGDGGFILADIFSDSKAVMAVQVADRMWDYLAAHGYLGDVEK